MTVGFIYVGISEGMIKIETKLDSDGPNGPAMFTPEAAKKIAEGIILKAEELEKSKK